MSPPGSDSDTSVPWVSKYRPQSLDDIVYQDDIIRTLKKTCQDGNLPHLLFYGPPGTGKTSTILALAHQLFGDEHVRDRILELNASDERGIRVVRTKIKSFSRITVSLEHAMSSANPNGKPIPSFKIVILDEADSMTADAQNALRRLMELYTPVTRFCLICNYVTRIIEPIISRTAKMRFRPLQKSAMLERLHNIASKETFNCPQSWLSQIVEFSNGDLRKAINLLQSASNIHGGLDVYNSNSEKWAQSLLLDLAFKVPQPVIEDIIKDTMSSNMSLNEIQELVQTLISDAYPVQTMLLQLIDYVAEYPLIKEQQRAKAFRSIAHADAALVTGADPELQLLLLASDLYLLRTP